MRKFIKTNLAKAKRWWRLRKMRASGLMSLDALAKIYGTRRRRGETDEQLRARIVKTISSLHERPVPLSGEELDMRAWLNFQIRRLPGETDEELRTRCMNEADNELANAPTAEGMALGEWTPGRYAWESVNKEAEI